MKLFVVLLLAVAVAQPGESFDDATRANCPDIAKFGYKWSYTKERCYCPKSRMKLLYDGTWVCKLGDEMTPFRFDYDTPPSRITTSRCHGDRKGYVYVPETGKCECREDKKFFVDGTRGGPQTWVCRFSATDMRELLEHESTPDSDEVGQEHCISQRLKWDARAFACKCRKEHFVFGGADQDIEGNIYCDLGNKRERAVFKHGVAPHGQFTYLTGTAARDADRFALINANSQNVQTFNLDRYTATQTRRRRDSRYFRDDHGPYFVNGEAIAHVPKWEGSTCGSTSGLKPTCVQLSKYYSEEHKGTIRCENAQLPPANNDSRCCLDKSQADTQQDGVIMCKSSAVRTGPNTSFYIFVPKDHAQEQSEAIY